MKAAQRLVYFDGIPLYDLETSVSVDVSPLYSTNERLTSYRTTDTSYYLSFVVWCYGSYNGQARMLEKLYGKYSCKTNFGILGQGWLCSACGAYSPSGAIECVKCGGTAESDFVKPMQFPFYFTDIATNEMIHRSDEPYSVRVDMVGYGDECYDAILAIASGQDVFSTNGYSLGLGYYLCSYCGQAVREGEDCLGCGGKRFKYQELIELDRTCVYCGRDIKGGIVCLGCGARIRGLTFDKAFRKVA